MSSLFVRRDQGKAVGWNLFCVPEELQGQLYDWSLEREGGWPQIRPEATGPRSVAWGKWTFGP